MMPKSRQLTHAHTHAHTEEANKHAQILRAAWLLMSLARPHLFATLPCSVLVSLSPYLPRAPSHSIFLFILLSIALAISPRAAAVRLFLASRSACKYAAVGRRNTCQWLYRKRKLIKISVDMAANLGRHCAAPTRGLPPTHSAPPSRPSKWHLSSRICVTPHSAPMRVCECV